MKLLLSLLVVANLLLFGWLRGWMAPFGGDGREPTRVDRQVRPDALRVVVPPGRPAGGAPSAGGGAAASGASAADGRVATPQPDAPPPPTGPALASALRAANCAEIGPMSESDAVRVQVSLDAVAADLAIATQRAEDITSWWVYLPPSSVDVTRRIADLRERGVTDIYVMPDGIWKGAISLGLFRQEELAQALQRSIGQKGVKGVRVAPRGPSAGRMTLQVRPTNDAIVAELAKLRAAMPEAIARPCAARS